MTVDTSSNITLSYARAGVDIDAGTALVEDIGECVRSTHGPEVLAGLGGFGGLRRFRPILELHDFDGL